MKWCRLLYPDVVFGTIAVVAAVATVSLLAQSCCEQPPPVKCPSCDCSALEVEHIPIENQVKLFPSMEEETLETLKDGDEVYTVCWAMYATPDRLLWLYGDYTYKRERFGTAEMRVRKEEGHYDVDITLCEDHRWELGSGRMPGSTWNPLPVYGLRNERGLVGSIKR